MNAPATPTPIQAFAPDIANRFGRIVLNLAILVAARLLHSPHEALTLPLWTWLRRTARRFGRLMTLLAANRLPKPRPPRPHQPRPEAARTTRLPTGHLWLIRAIPGEAAALASQLDHLLAEPGVAELLATCPAAIRLLRPLARMLGLQPPPSPQSPGLRGPGPQNPAPRPRPPSRPNLARPRTPTTARAPNGPAPIGPARPGPPPERPPPVPRHARLTRGAQARPSRYDTVPNGNPQAVGPAHRRRTSLVTTLDGRCGPVDERGRTPRRIGAMRDPVRNSKELYSYGKRSRMRDLASLMRCRGELKRCLAAVTARPFSITRSRRAT